MPADRTLAALVCGLLCALAAGCEDAAFSHLEFRERSADAEADAELGEREITLFEGLAVGARVSAIGDDDEPMPVLRLRSLDPDVVGVERGPVLGWFVFYGVRPGNAELDVLSDGRRVGRVAVTVAPQPGVLDDEAR